MTGLYPSWSLTGIPCRMHRISFDLCPNYLLGWGTARTVLRVLSAFANVITAALPSVGGAKGERESMVRLVPILVADGHTVCCIVASCIPDDQRSPAPPANTKLLLFAPCTCKAAFLLRANKHVYFLALALWSPYPF
jgi:hypothetical protein